MTVVSGNVEVLPIGEWRWSGHCQFPCTGPGDPEVRKAESHERCQRNGLYFNKPTGKYLPCKCGCHLGEEFECTCGFVIREAPMLGPDEDGDLQYVHIDGEGNYYSTECP